jgi:hypothetical protein
MGRGGLVWDIFVMRTYLLFVAYVKRVEINFVTILHFCNNFEFMACI